MLSRKSIFRKRVAHILLLAMLVGCFGSFDGRAFAKEVMEKETVVTTADAASENKPAGEPALEMNSGPAGLGPIETDPDHLNGAPDIAFELIDLSGGKDSPRVRSAAAAPGAAGDHPQNPGEVKLFKTVAPVPGKLNTFQVNLRMEAMDDEKSNDIVLVIDTSGSMADDGRMANAKAAATQFVNQLLVAEQPNTRIQLISFQSNVTVHTGFLNHTGKQDLLNAISGLDAVGGTFTQGGMKAAKDSLRASAAELKHLVFLSDGEPTYSYRLDQPDHYLIPYGSDQQTGANAPESAYPYDDRVGNGQSMWWRYESNWFGPDKYYNHGHSAIAEAGFVKGAGATVHTIAMAAGADGTPVLEAMASEGHAHATNDPAELTPIFAGIAGQISAAMQDAYVVDPMGAGFHVTGGAASHLVPSQGTATYDPDDQKIDWDVGTLTVPIAPGSKVKYADLTYEIEINDDILTVVSPDGLFATNGDATVSYTDINGEEQTSAFPAPSAKPLIVEMHKALLDATGKVIPTGEAEKRTFQFHLTLREDTAFEQNYWVKGNTSRIMTDIRIDGTYQLQEKAIGGAVTSAFEDYDTSVQWATWDGSQSVPATSGTVLSDFRVPRGAANEPLNTKITVTNKEKPRGQLSITKAFDPGVRGILRGPEPVFTVQIRGQNIYDLNDQVYNETIRIKAGETKVLKGLVYGEYTVVETESHGFTPSYSDSEGVATDGKVKIKVDAKTQSVDITNAPASGDATVQFVAKKKWQGGAEADHLAVALDLYRDGVLWLGAPAATVSPASGTAAEFTYTWPALPKYNANGAAITYSIKESTVPPNYSATYNEASTEVTNTYGLPQTEDIIATKVWDASNDAAVTPPGIKFELWRQGGTAGAGEQVADATALTNGEVNFGKQDKTDINGVAYTYYVKEVFDDPADPTNDNWVVTENGLSVNNRVINNADPDHPEKVAQLTVQKVLADGTSNAAFTMTVTGPYDYSETFTLKAGESKSLSNLYYGSYTVQEAVPSDFTASYAPADKVTLSKDNPEGTVTVTNKKKSGSPGGGGGTVHPPSVDPEAPEAPPIVDPEVPALIKNDHFVYMFGYPDKRFRPDGHITRAEVASMFARLMVEKMVDGQVYPSPFHDVAPQAWYANTVGYMAQKNIIKGHPDGTFRPDEAVTRAEFAAIAARFDRLEKGQSDFPDVAADHWAKGAIDLAFTKGWVKGYPDGTFKPENQQTRAETIAVTNKMLERVGDEAFITAHADELAHFSDLTEKHWGYIDIMEACNSHDFEREEGKLQERWLRLRGR